MITNFKIFENKNIFTSEDCSYWVIYGAISHCFNILKKMELEYRLTYELKNVLESMNENILDDNYPFINGVLIFFESYSYHSSFKYGGFDSDDERNEILDSMSEYNFKGEIKVINDKISVDTLEVNTNKYNL